jgi:hypothetical protein
MKFIADLNEKSWKVEGDADAFSMTYEISVKRGSEEVVYFDELSFGYEISEGGDLVAEESYPPENVVYRSSDQEFLASGLVSDLSPEKEYFARLWIKEGGEEFEETFSFTTPKPPQPYPSWTWNEETSGWESPIEYPTDDPDNVYFWKEDELKWVVAEEPMV